MVKAETIGGSCRSRILRVCTDAWVVVFKPFASNQFGALRPPVTAMQYIRSTATPVSCETGHRSYIYRNLHRNLGQSYAATFGRLLPRLCCAPHCRNAALNDRLQRGLGPVPAGIPTTSRLFLPTTFEPGVIPAQPLHAPTPMIAAILALTSLGRHRNSSFSATGLRPPLRREHCDTDSSTVPQRTHE